MFAYRLAEYAAAHPELVIPDGYAEQQVRWELALDREGRLRSLELADLRTAENKYGPITVVPSAVRRGSVVRPLPTLDNLAYVLGWWQQDGDDPSLIIRTDESQKKHQAWVDAVQEWAESEYGQQDPVVAAVAAFLRSGQAQQVLPPDEWNRNELVHVTVDGRRLSLADSAHTHWSKVREAGADNHSICPICGRSGPVRNIWSSTIPARLIPGASNAVSFASNNCAAFSYQGVDQLAGSPVCLQCSSGATQALVSILGRNRIDTADSVLTWWKPRQGADVSAMDWFTTQAPVTEDEVRRWVTQLHTGSDPTAREIEDAEMFCSARLGQRGSRLRVMEWIEMPLGDLNRNVAAWLNDTGILDGSGEVIHLPLWKLASSFGRYEKDSFDGYASKSQADQRRCAQARWWFLHSGMTGRPIPGQALTSLLDRIRRDGHIGPSRAAVLRLLLSRHPYTPRTTMPGLDPNNTDPAYISGQLLALIDEIQYRSVTATDKNARLNRTFLDRHFSSALRNPRRALLAAESDMRHWLSKLARTNPETAYHLQGRYAELMARLDASDGGAPNECSEAQQALVALGCHHYVADRRARIKAAKEAKATAETLNNDRS